MKASETALAGLSVVLLVGGCGGQPPPDAAGVTTESQAQSGPASSSVHSNELSSADVCALLQADEVRAILGASPNPTPRSDPQQPGASFAACVWDAGGGNGDVTLSVAGATDQVYAAILKSTPIEGDALGGLGDQAGVTVQGNYNVEVMVRIGPRIMTLEASAVGVADRQDAVVAAARSAVSKLE